ncbi:MAG TPA: GntR family transcriptional regulator, partial [Paracoccaceae bacterium]
MSDQNASTFPFEERVEKQSPVPLYYQIENLLQQQIREGAFAPGDQLPTEKDLCEHFQVSR